MTDWIDSEISELQPEWRYRGALVSCGCLSHNSVFKHAVASPATATRENGLLTSQQIQIFNDSIAAHKRENSGTHDVTIFIAAKGFDERCDDIYCG